MLKLHLQYHGTIAHCGYDGGEGNRRLVDVEALGRIPGVSNPQDAETYCLKCLYSCESIAAAEAAIRAGSLSAEHTLDQLRRRAEVRHEQAVARRTGVDDEDAYDDPIEDVRQSSTKSHLTFMGTTSYCGQPPTIGSDAEWGRTHDRCVRCDTLLNRLRHLRSARNSDDSATEQYMRFWDRLYRRFTRDEHVRANRGRESGESYQIEDRHPPARRQHAERAAAARREDDRRDATRKALRERGRIVSDDGSRSVRVEG